MIKLSKNSVRSLLLTAALVLVAFGCRRVAVLFGSDFVDKLFNFTRTFIYIGLYSAWGISVSRRVIHPLTRRLLVGVSALMVSWFVLREIKFRFIPDENVIRYFWYLYYIPLLLIPLIALLVSLLLGKSADCRLPRSASFLYAVTFVLIGLVLTNDFHQLVFRFPAGSDVWTEFNRSPGFMYYVIIAWGVLCTLGALAFMLGKCRIPHSKRVIWLPLVPFSAAIAYFVLSSLNIPVIKLFLSDFAAVCCILFAGFFESCIVCGLIQSNSSYSALFSASVNAAVQITDNDYNVRYKASSAEKLSKEIMQSAEHSPVLFDGGKRLQNMPLNGGHAIWTEDISELIELREKLEDRQEELRERNALLQYEYAKEKDHRIIEEQNRLYDLLQSKTQAQLDSINRLVREYGRAQSDESKRKILSHIVVLGSYIKRSKDFALSADSNPEIPPQKLESALSESFRALRFLNIRGGYLVDADRELLPAKSLILAYDFFEDVAEAVLDRAAFINVRVSELFGALRINILTDCSAPLESIAEKYPTAMIISEDDGTAFVLSEKGGEQ